ncbi:hypothetical protein [Limnobacter parvus]|uniref:Type 4 secretion system PilS N-terminal domain-containing protein n=1 Tax=Limnobacter parvus TaxID=2939690 RepID=A0ABT1XG20_9BURK|nr:hypothetical protein [Limnobacter parvus]MCR2745069.1 hypothetical protein [Limnobacter parvus]
MQVIRQTRPLLVKQSAQSGFIQAALLFGIALMTAVLGGFALANRSPTSQTDVEQAKVNASVILKQASDLRDGVARYSSDFGSSAVEDTMDFTGTTQVGLFDPAARYASPQIMPTSAFVAGPATVIQTLGTNPLAAGHWYINRATPGDGLGGPGVDPMVVLPGLRQDVCGRVNTLLYGTANIPVGTAALTAWTTDADGGLGTAGDAAGWPEGCVETSDASYVYFKAVQEN